MSFTYNRFSLKRCNNTVAAIATATAYARVYVIRECVACVHAHCAVTVIEALNVCD